MILENLISTPEQAERLKDLGIVQTSLFAHCKLSHNNKPHVACAAALRHGYVDWTGQCNEHATYTAAFGVSEIAAVLKNRQPVWIAIWGEWGYQDARGNKRGYENMATCYSERLIDALAHGEMIIEEVNKILTKNYE